MKEVSNCCSLRPLREKVAEGRMRGFTLIELLVVVMIIAILAAIAVPQYKHAVLKSRFSTVMPMAKSIADAQEVYYQGRQMYALDVDELDVTPVRAENTTVSLSGADGYDYVMARRSDVPGTRYVIYQKYSENYPGEIHCEAQEGNADAQWLCGVLSNNNALGQTITTGYTTYLINGSGAGIPSWAQDIDCADAQDLGLTCKAVQDENGNVGKQVCINGFCRAVYETENGTTSITCQANSEGVCTDTLVMATYDAAGHKTSEKTCGILADDGTCSTYTDAYDSDWTYDENGHLTRYRKCSKTGNKKVNGVNIKKCTAYDTYNYTYDENGHKISEDYINGGGKFKGHKVFDGNGHLTSTQTCTIVTGTTCRYDTGYDYTYDESGKLTSERRCSKTLASDGTCDSYNVGIDYSYDENGKKISELSCETIESDGTCSAYWRRSNYTYDANGNQTSQRTCSTASDGTCSAYDSTLLNYDYTYDANGNMTSERRCKTVESDGTCSAYSASTGDVLYYTYDANGNKTSQQNCKTVESDGTCSLYTGTSYYYTYDDNGKQVAEQKCSGNNLNTATGECTAYNSTTVYGN